MRRFMKQLTADVHFHTAMLDQKPVAVFIADELIGCGRIYEITDDSVKVGYSRYLRENCTFKYAG